MTTQPDKDVAENLRLRMFALSKEFCSITNDANAAGLVISGNHYFDPAGKLHALGPTVAKIVPYEPGSGDPE